MKISNKLKALAMGGTSVVAVLGNSVNTFAGKVKCPNGKDAAGNDLTQCAGLNENNSSNTNDLMKQANNIINVVIGVIGFVAVAFIIFGGIQYTTSAGDPGKVKKAKDTILYGIVGLVVAMLAYAIVNFVLSSAFKA
ncbi:hypothetical protein EUA79_02630 [TM7 phylum sp. oral taxon 351]|jgi:hypothetical protein cdivTM_30108|nr:hypothetical protein EUA79_02630 [TM7 phylum sp. oral taxon 351]